MSKERIAYLIHPNTFNTIKSPRHNSSINKLAFHTERLSNDSQYSLGDTFDTETTSQFYSTLQNQHATLYSGGRDGLIINYTPKTVKELSYHSEWVNDIVSHDGNRMNIVSIYSIT